MSKGYELVPAGAASFQAVTTAEAKLHLRIDQANTLDDTAIDNLIKSATEKCEGHLDAQICRRAWTLYLDKFPSGRKPIYLPRGRFIGLSSDLDYTDTAGAAQTILEADLVENNVGSMTGSISPAIGDSWPSATTELPSPIAVAYECGWETADDVPLLIKQAILLTVGFLYENREAQNMPLGAEDLLASFRNGDEFSRYGGDE